MNSGGSDHATSAAGAQELHFTESLEDQKFLALTALKDYARAEPFPHVNARLLSGEFVATDCRLLESHGSVIGAPRHTALRHRARQLSFNRVIAPELSIIVPVHDNIAVTLKCLESIEQNTRGVEYEIIVVDDASGDQTKECLMEIQGAIILDNVTNLGFVHSSNIGARAAGGRYLLFLNNDTEVTASWAETLLSVFSLQKDAGIAGSKLLYPDGRLQEAGAVVTGEADSIRIGNLDDPDRPQYNYPRETGYCSAACMLIPKDLFNQLGGFDVRFAPGYYEDVDLAFKVRQVGLKVYYQPLSVVIHHEGLSRDRETPKRSSLNQIRFRDKWRDSLDKALTLQGARVTVGRGRYLRNAVLIIAAPLDGQSSSFFDRTVGLCSILQAVGFGSTLLPIEADLSEAAREQMQQRGIECIYQPYSPAIEEFLKTRGKEFSLIILSSLKTAEKTIDVCRRYAPFRGVAIDAADIALDDLLSASRIGPNTALNSVRLSHILACNALIARTQQQQRTLSAWTRQRHVALIPTRLRPQTTAAAADGDRLAENEMRKLISAIGTPVITSSFLKK